MPNGPAPLALAASLVAGSGAAAADEGTIRLRVNPSGYERPRETLDEKVARRERESEYRFRWICRGCLPANQEPRQAAPTDPAGLLGAASR